MPTWFCSIPQEIADTATFDDPQRPAKGIHCVWVNGVLSYTAEGPTGDRAGRFLAASRKRSIPNNSSGSGQLPEMIDPHSAFLLASTLIAVVGLILLVAVFKLNPFLSLLLVSLGLGAAAGMPLATVIHSFELGMGNTLGHIAIVVALGTMLGKMMAESGAADTIAHTLIRWFGEKRVPLAMVTAGLVVGLPAFFEVGFVLLIPIAFTVARRTRTSLILVCLPMVAGLSVVHGLVPPHPAAMMAVMIYKADVGRTIFYGLLVGVPTALIAGPLFARIIAPYVHIADRNPMAEELAEHDTSRTCPDSRSPCSPSCSRCF